MIAILPAPPTSSLPEPATRRWRPLRAGLQNIWQYDHATRFVFHQGRLLLRGRNGSGKTKAVEVLLPFLLEGRLDPARLDPFRTRSRKMHYNLLHEANRDLTVNVAYVWLEFGRLDEDGLARYTTIGAGLKARRSEDKVSSWFFVAVDRRIDDDLHLVDGDRRPLAKPALVEALGDGGRVYDSGRDYAAAVNRALFGLSPTQYEALVEAVLRLRQPHLSERLDPAGVGAVLADSLPPLDTEKVHEVAEGFERLESHRRELADRRRSLEAVETFLDAYRDYATTVTAVRARRLTRADSAVRDAAERIRSAKSDHADAAELVAELGDERSRIERELSAVGTRIRTLETSDQYRAVQELEGAQDAEADAGRRFGSAADRRDRDGRELAAAERDRDGAAAKVAEQRRHVSARGRDAQTAAARADLAAAHGAIAGQVDAAIDAAGSVDRSAAEVDAAAGGSIDAARGTTASVHRHRIDALDSVRARQRAVRAAEDAEHTARERLDDATERARVADEQAVAAEGAQQAARAAFGEAVEDWAATAAECALPEDAITALLDTDPVDAAGFARDLARPARERLDAAAAGAQARLAVVRGDREAAAAERDALAAATHRPPPVPGWRDADRAARRGAPLYLLAEPVPDLTTGEQACVEAALEAAGLLDAWVNPEGRVPGRDVLDAALVAGAPAAGRTLADVLTPTPTGGVGAEVVRELLARVALVDGGAKPAAETADRGSAWVSLDGRFGLGPLRGTARRDEVAYLGETAREQARARRLAELDAQLRVLAAEEERIAAEIAAVQERLAALDAELAAFPSASGVLTARAEAAAAARAAQAAAAERERHRAAHTEATEALEQARAERDQAAWQVGLLAHVDRLEELAAATADWLAAVGQWLAAAEVAVERADRLAAQDELVRTTAARADASAADAERAGRELADAGERVAALRSLIGADHEQVVVDLRAARDRRTSLDERTRALVDERIAAAERHAVAVKELEVATAEHARLDAERSQAAAGIRGLADLGVLQIVLGRDLDDPASWSMTAALEHAREAARQGPRIHDDEDGATLVEAAQNGLARRQQELTRDLVAGIRLFGRTDYGVVIHDVQYAGRTFRLPALVAELREDVAERDRRLATDEQALLERFLAGELHEHLRARIRDASQLVRRMNDRLAGCPTGSGQRVRLRWEVDENAPAGTGAAVDLLLRGAGLLTDDQRAELQAFLHDRLRQARDGDAAASLHERIGTAFDYRRWHAFRIDVRDRTSPSWKRLTRQSHATGSGGEKAVMLHLPLFAAMAAHYGASPDAPRLIVLDEVFAGIDRGTRGQLMGLLVDLDLDALLTSHEEWGFYAELDGLATYHLVRDPDVPGVLAEWFVWDGTTRWQL